eukprot:11189087-Lingulodinium_polyedra.AAC.1
MRVPQKMIPRGCCSQSGSPLKVMTSTPNLFLPPAHPAIVLRLLGSVRFLRDRAFISHISHAKTWHFAPDRSNISKNR